MPDQPLTYASSGVDIDSAQRSIRSLESAIKATYDDRVLSNVGGFGGLFSGTFEGLNRPILVSSIDGVGTKTKVAAMMGDFRHLGADIVNHCINDILCQGAKPLFFMDYFGCSQLSPTVFDQVVRGAAEACEAQGCALIGGETAEMPGVYLDDEIDIVGAIVGVVDGDKKLPNGASRAGDKVIGLASDGLHTNGYSLARKALFEKGGLSVRDELAEGVTIGEALLKPHRCYAKAVHAVMEEMGGVHAIAHITGGGLYDNIPRVLPSDLQVLLDRRTFTPPELFQLIQRTGEVPDFEMYRSFNMGIGLVLIADKDLASAIVTRLGQLGENAAIIGELQDGPNDVQIV
ncbi:MAG: phosphoribosylformylglycinamidine cyclo-ligase [Chthonomonas sp.]|nr:phosphoribosylformylglycinamidine cyclo-ligase [Chthonomonas sp.]